MKIFKLLFLMFIFNSCDDVATLSRKEANNISNLKVKIVLTSKVHFENGTKKKSVNFIKVFLSNGKKQIINENIKVLLNNKLLKLRVRQGNYYDKHSYYTTADDLLLNESYYFEIILPDSIKYPLAYIKPNKITTEFNSPKNIFTNEDFVLKWTKLYTPHEFKYMKGVEYKSEKHNVTKFGYDGKRRDTLTAKEGQYIIPKSYFINDSLKRTKYLETTLTHKETGLINPNLLKNSSIKYNYTIEEKIYIKEEE